MLQMKTTVLKTTIIATLKKQLEEHEKAITEAKQKWQEKLLSVAQQIVNKEGKLKRYPQALCKLQSVPRSHAKELRELIARFENHIGDAVELTTQDYSMVMEGRWHWMHEFAVSNALYGCTGATGPTGLSGAVGTCGLEEEDPDFGVGEISAELSEDELE